MSANFLFHSVFQTNFSLSSCSQAYVLSHSNLISFAPKLSQFRVTNLIVRDFIPDLNKREISCVGSIILAETIKLLQKKRNLILQRASHHLLKTSRLEVSGKILNNEFTMDKIYIFLNQRSDSEHALFIGLKVTSNWVLFFLA